ncbi:tyrosine-type recombinase/integrase [Pseudonocardia sp. EV170527-09]|nr:tyrosine-type recombinase/integrase [Pseudonocardia sp. EV170527-09]
MTSAGARPATAHQVHRTARTAFGEAYKRGNIGRNPVALAKAPRLDEEEIEPFEVEEIRRLIATALTRRNGVRYVLALALGTRQGETIGLRWERYSASTRFLRIVRQLQRQTWQHGCSDPHSCGERYHKREQCRADCKRHTRACPPPCPADCTSHARWCPQRHGGGLVETEVKSRAGRRGIVLPEQLAELVERHRIAQDAERERAGSIWEYGGWMFAQENGRPIGPTMDREQWLQLLNDAGVRAARLHDARHTAATVLLLLGVPERVVMDVMGWSNTAMAKRYQHVTAVLRQDVALRLDEFLRGGD